MRHDFPDHYRPAAGLVHRMDPRLKLLTTVAFVLAATTTPPGDWVSLAALAGLALAAVGLSRTP